MTLIGSTWLQHFNSQMKGTVNGIYQTANIYPYKVVSFLQWFELDCAVCCIKIAALYIWNSPLDYYPDNQYVNVVHLMKKIDLIYCEKLVSPRGAESLNMPHHSNTLRNKHHILSNIAELGTNYLNDSVVNQCSWKTSQHFLSFK